MKNAKGLDFLIDKLTNSIENVVTGDSFQTDVNYASSLDIRSVTKKSGWLFDWQKEIVRPEREIYKLTIVNNPSIIQGLVSLEVKTDNVLMHLLESAPYNLGKTKIYSGVPGNLVAFACRLSFQRGYDGYVSFMAKTKLINHYIDTLGARHYGGSLMVIESNAAIMLINKYFKNQLS